MFYRVQMEWEDDTGATRDESMNVWHFISDEVDSPADEAESIAGHVADFYQALKGYYSPNLTGNLRGRVYELQDPTPRVALYDHTFVLTGAFGSGPLPNEVAACLSMRSTGPSGADRRRRRGRVFLGPLGGTETSVSGTGDVRVNLDFIGDVQAAGLDLLNIADVGGSTFQLCVFSRATAGAPNPDGSYDNADLVASFFPVDHLIMDNAFDTQRRRGVAPTVTVVVP